MKSKQNPKAVSHYEIFHYNVLSIIKEPTLKTFPILNIVIPYYEAHYSMQKFVDKFKLISVTITMPRYLNNPTFSST